MHLNRPEFCGFWGRINAIFARLHGAVYQSVLRSPRSLAPRRYHHSPWERRPLHLLRRPPPQLSTAARPALPHASPFPHRPPSPPSPPALGSVLKRSFCLLPGCFTGKESASSVRQSSSSIRRFARRTFPRGNRPTIYKWGTLDLFPLTSPSVLQSRSYANLRRVPPGRLCTPRQGAHPVLPAIPHNKWPARSRSARSLPWCNRSLSDRFSRL